MKSKTASLILALCFVGAGLSFAQENPMIGTWKLNEAKSKFAKGTTKNHTVIYQAEGDKTKVTVEGTDATGAAAHNEWTGMFDGKDYAVTGGPAGQMRSYKKVNDRTLTFEEKDNGKVILTGRIVVSPDGKTRTVKTSATNKEGVKISSTAVYDKVS